MLRLFRSKSAPVKSARRREELRRVLAQPAFSLGAVLRKPELIHTTIILAAFVLVTSTIVIWSRDQVKVIDNQIMTATKLKRLKYEIEDEEQTKIKREEARKSAARVYKLNESYLGRLKAAIQGLPKAVAGKLTLEEISEELREGFNLSEEDLRELQAMMKGDEPAPEWVKWTEQLVQEQLVANPLIRSQEYQVYITTANKELMLPDGTTHKPAAGQPIELRADHAALPDPKLLDVVRWAGFPRDLAPIVASRLAWDKDAQPSFVFDEEATKRRAELAVAAVGPVTIEHKKGEVLYRRGDLLTIDQYNETVREAEQYRQHASWGEKWQRRLGVIGLISLVTLFLGSFVIIAYPKIVHNPFRVAAVCALMAGMVAVTVLITVNAPMFIYPATIGPALFAAIIFLVAYDQRLALLLSGIECILATLALEQSIGFFILLIAGGATIVAQLRELRHRNSLIRAATATGAVLIVGTIMLGFLELPNIGAAYEQIALMSFSALMTSYGVSFLVLGILPSIERIFDITTGMTLAELRDPKRPLLRQLQQRAPGTYNHSLQVANIAEAAAEAINADSLLVYVGALYHDVGKINKPEYFVENQGGGFNRHDKLSPAMSLLVIIGHVKNGIELAREYGLPRPIIHFIESHHGTTLVEYFYHAAKAKAEANDEADVRDVEYRYPGPKPRTKEAAILMLADAVESATRTMAEPNPSRIENLVRKLSARRLEDGQFDQCDLTFRELALIEDAMINRLLAIYHSRISYPSTSGGKPATATEPGEPAWPQPKPISA